MEEGEMGTVLQEQGPKLRKSGVLISKHKRLGKREKIVFPLFASYELLAN
jgi:hypothetical protein